VNVTTEPKETIVTIQQTSKKFKIAQIIAVALMCMGMVSCVAKAQPVVNGVFWVLGIAFYVYARAGAWWRNG